MVRGEKGSVQRNGQLFKWPHRGVEKVAKGTLAKLGSASYDVKLMKNPVELTSSELAELVRPLIPDLNRNVYSLRKFCAERASLVDRMKLTGRPLVLTANEDIIGILS